MRCSLVVITEPSVARRRGSCTRGRERRGRFDPSDESSPRPGVARRRPRAATPRRRLAARRAGVGAARAHDVLLLQPPRLRRLAARVARRDAAAAAHPRRRRLLARVGRSVPSRLRARRRRRAVRRPRGGHAARADRARHRPRPRARDVGRGDQRRGDRRRAQRRRASSGSTEAWCDIDRSKVFDGSVVRRLATLARTPHAPARQRVAVRDARRAAAGAAASRTSRCRFSASPRASSAPASTGSPTGRSCRPSWPRPSVPGLLAPVQIGGEHFIDGGVVNSIPLSRAIALGARAGLRPARRAAGPPAGAAALAVGGRARGLRDRPPPPLRRRPRGDPERRRRARPGDRAAGPAALHRPLAVSLPRHDERPRAHRPRPRGVGALPRRARAGARGDRGPVPRPPPRRRSARAALRGGGRRDLSRCWR